jgi:peptidoglycan/xylan/chitin deacetylase (PgdA/CDA1 family)
MSLSQQLRKIIFSSLYYTGIPFLLREVVDRDKTTIVVLHAPSPEAARGHFEALRKRYNVIPLADYLRARIDGRAGELPPKSLIITMDDGHRSNAQLKSLLQEMEIPITIFLCSGIVGTHRHFWWLHIRSSSEAKACKQMTDAERLEFLLSRDYHPEQEYPDRQALSKSEIEELKPLVDFQAHSVSHPILPACGDEKAEGEIERCKTDLEQLYGLKIEAFAFPNGDCSERDIVMTRNAGYRCALTIDTGINDIDTDLFRLRRVSVPDDAPVSELLVKASGFWRRLRYAHGLLKQFLPGAKSREATAYETATPKPQEPIGACEKRMFNWF